MAALAGGVLVAVTLVLALTDAHLDGATAALTISTAAAAIAVPLLALQPLLAAVARVRWHRVLGLAVFALVAVHVAALFVESPADARFAMSPDGPTRARMALIATIALAGVVALGVGRRRLPLRPATWRIVHAYLAAVVLVLGVGHAVLTDGALDDSGTALLLALGAAGRPGRAVRLRG